MKKEQLLISFNSSFGFSVVEVVLAGALFALFLTALVGAILYGEVSTALSGGRSRALALADEGVEAARNIRDSDFANLTTGTHGLAISANQWVFSGTQDLTDIFTRQITVSTIDAKRKSVVSTVTWQQNPQRTGTVALTTRLTNWLAMVSSNWGNIIQEASLDFSGAQDGFKIQVQGNYAYVVRSDGTPDFVVVDITNSASPSIAGSLSLVGIPTNIVLAGGYAYVSSRDNGQELQVIDISTPSLPSVAGTFNAAGSADGLGIYISGTSAYLVRASSVDDEFLTVNVSTPSSPTLVGSLDLGDNGNEVVVLGSHAYVASSHNSQELQAVDISTPSAPSLAGSFNLSGTANAVSISGFGAAVTLGRANGFFHTFNVSTPSSPSGIGSVDVAGSINDISLGIGDTHAFLATSAGANEFQVLDISVVATPTLLGTFNITGINPLNGVVYHDTKDRVFGVGNSDTEEFFVFAHQ